MVKKTVTYTDFNGNQRTDDFYFHYSKPELAEMELSLDGGLTALLEKIIKEKDQRRLIEYFKKILVGAFGIKSADGTEFMKDDEIRKHFVNSAAYPEIFMELATDDKAASDFVNGLLPADIVKQIEEENKSGQLEHREQFQALPGKAPVEAAMPLA